MAKTKLFLTLEDPKKIAAAAEAEARRNKWPVVISIVDEGRHLLYLMRLDNTQYGSFEVAIQKARSAIAFRRPTMVLEEQVNQGHVRYLNLPGAISIEGGLPIVLSNQFVGAIGVSGVRSHQDAQIAQAGINALNSDSF